MDIHTGGTEKKRCATAVKIGTFSFLGVGNHGMGWDGMGYGMGWDGMGDGGWGMGMTKNLHNILEARTVEQGQFRLFRGNFDGCSTWSIVQQG